MNDCYNQMVGIVKKMMKEICVLLREMQHCGSNGIIVGNILIEVIFTIPTPRSVQTCIG